MARIIISEQKDVEENPYWIKMDALNSRQPGFFNSDSNNFQRADIFPHLSAEHMIPASILVNRSGFPQDQ